MRRCGAGVGRWWGGGGAVGQGGVFCGVILHGAKARRTLTCLPYLVQLSDNKQIRINSSP